MDRQQGRARVGRAERWTRAVVVAAVLAPAALFAMRRARVAEEPGAAERGASIAHAEAGIAVMVFDGSIAWESTDSASVSAFLSAVRGANPMICDLAARSVDGCSGWSSGYGSAPGSPAARDPRAREIVRTVTGELRDPAVVPVLRPALSDADPCVRRMAALLLGRAQTPQAFRALEAALRASHAETREVAALGLGYADDARAVAGLVEALRDASPRVRATAAWALGAIEDPAAIPPLIAALRGDADPEVRRAAAWALGEIE